ncbi:hypothetical protein TanjilG_32119 [Lupinus angustifolius]|uniref:C2H2-type domain-containing protein n=1 Tax=Lupinus angustifolius TaxID=3871 RepID=A0A1J7I3B7_LUPAN|nr:PREDICTED: transcriptional regulator SUPERMAN-like [Lupinus angustifolius]OIW13138.1 hypothetical protein TanjilG_32119 [Lupinus angustifolius]
MKSVIEGISSETSTEETDNQKEDLDDSITSKRSYDCTFCKRGFTNAQALGGHMNIHRKDKAKAKQGISTKNLSMAPSFIPQTSTFYSMFQSQGNYDIHFQPSTIPNYPTNPPAYAFQYEFINPTRYESMGANYQELLGSNLSLQIASSHVSSDEVRKGIQNDEVVDLELRLSHHPYSN